MNKENTRKLFKRFPFLKKTDLPDGFGCGDGWYTLVYDMCKELKSVNPPDDFTITKIAERHGELEVHSKNGVMRTRVAIDEFNTVSIGICDECGNDRDLEKCDKCTVEVIEYPDPEEDEDDSNAAPALCTTCYIVPCKCPCATCSASPCTCPCTTCSASPCTCFAPCVTCGSTPCMCGTLCSTCSSNPCTCSAPCGVCPSGSCTCAPPCPCGVRNCNCP